MRISSRPNVRKAWAKASEGNLSSGVCIKLKKHKDNESHRSSCKPRLVQNSHHVRTPGGTLLWHKPHYARLFLRTISNSKPSCTLHAPSSITSKKFAFFPDSALHAFQVSIISPMLHAHSYVYHRQHRYVKHFPLCRDTKGTDRLRLFEKREPFMG